MKQFLVFYGPAYYPGGGWTDFEQDFDSKEEAINCAKIKSHWGSQDSYSWGHVVDSLTKEIIWDGGPQ